MSSVISCPISSPFISSPLIVLFSSFLLFLLSFNLLSSPHLVLSSHLFPPLIVSFSFIPSLMSSPIISSRLISSHPTFSLPPTSLAHFVICTVVFVSDFACGSSLPVARCAVGHEPRNGRTKISLPHPCAGNDNNPRKPVDTQTHTHRGDILECYCKGVVSYPPYKVIWSYTPEGNTLINSSTCSQTWPCLSPTHTHTHTFRAEQQRFSRIHLSLKVLIQNTEQSQKHTHTLKRASHWETNSVKMMKGRFIHNTRTWWQVWSISLQFQVLFAHTQKRAKYTHFKMSNDE